MGKGAGKRSYYTEVRSSFHETIKISSYCDQYSCSKKFAGAIIYRVNGRCTWRGKDGHTQKSPYFICQDTGKWDSWEFGRAGQGVVHDALLRHVLGKVSMDRVSATGFAVINGEIRYSSIFLNKGDRPSGESDGS